jgi:hypothetical protein
MFPDVADKATEALRFRDQGGHATGFELARGVRAMLSGMRKK